MGKLRLQLLGAFRLQDAAGKPIALPTKKSRALLAYLVLASGQRRSRASLASLLWDESGDQQARESLRQTLSLLRRALVGCRVPPIKSEGDTIALDHSELQVDVLEFTGLAETSDPEAMAEAANLYNGELLEGFDLHAPEFDRWLWAARQSIHEKAVDLLSRMLSQHLGSGNLERAASTATRLLSLDPLRESSHRALMELYGKQGRYPAALRQYKICCEVLARELNVEPEPGTTALYREIRQQRNAKREPASEIPWQRPEAADAKPPPPRPLERRQITVLACEMAGLNALSAELDPEELLPLAGEFRNQCVAVIERFGGHIERFAGDEFTALFGFPKADEYSAERAVQAGLALATEMRASAKARLQGFATRIGIATSPVVTGEFSAEKAEAALELIGEAPRTASLLRTVAPPNGVLIAGGTKELVGGLFECSELERPLFSGTGDRGPFWHVISEARETNRFAARHRQEKSPFLGRDAELDGVLDLWSMAESGRGHIAFITGDAGIGKSRLTLELQEQLKSRPHAALFYQCSPFHANSALYPFIRELERAADFHHTDSAAEKLDKLAALLARNVPAANDIAPLFAQLLSIPAQGRYPPLTLSSAQQRRKTLGALLDRVESFASRQPVLAVFEDVHWADASSLEVLDMLADRIRALPVLLAITSRPGFEPAWGGLEHVRQISLDRMIDRDARSLVENMNTGRTLPARIIDQIIVRTDGIPLFLEEMTQAVIESERSARRRDANQPWPAAPDFAIPATLQDSLMARLDRLGEAKVTAQIAAVIGRDFSQDLVRAVAAPSADRLDADLDLLTASGLITEQASVSGRSFAFKHALLRDTAYQSLLKGRRRQLHGAIAGAMRETLPEIEKNQPELVAHHLTQAGAIAPALGYWIKAGMLANSRLAYREAIAHLEQGLGWVPALEAAADKLRWERQFLAAMGPAVMAVKGYTASKSQHVFERAFELLDEDCPAPERLRIMFGLWNLRFHRGELPAALSLAGEILKLARETDLMVDLANCLTGQTLSAMGEFEAARLHLTEVIDSFRAGKQNPPSLFGVDESVLALDYLTRVLWALGYTERAEAAANEAITLARNGGKAVSIAVAYVGRIALAVQYPRSDGVDALMRVASAHAYEHGLPLFQNWCAFFGAAILLRRGQAAEALPKMQAAIATADDRLSRIFRPFQLGCLAAAHLELGNPAQALAVIDAAIVTGEITGEKQSEVTLYRTKAQVLLAMGQAGEAERQFRQALKIARRQKAKAEELRVALAMAECSDEAIDANRARATLAQIHAAFEEGFDLPEMLAASAALDRLTPTRADPY